MLRTAVKEMSYDLIEIYYRLKGLCFVLLQGNKFAESLFRRRRN
jgi:hypothetical protein